MTATGLIASMWLMPMCRYRGASPGGSMHALISEAACATTVNDSHDAEATFNTTTLHGSYEISHHQEHINAALVLMPNDVVELSMMYMGVLDAYGTSHFGGLKFEYLFY